MKTTKLKITGLILALMMVITPLGVFSMTAFAAEGDTALSPYAVIDTEA